jgi:hypothetical protein
MLLENGNLEKVNTFIHKDDEPYIIKKIIESAFGEEFSAASSEDEGDRDAGHGHDDDDEDHGDEDEDAEMEETESVGHVDYTQRTHLAAPDGPSSDDRASSVNMHMNEFVRLDDYQYEHAII